MLGVAKKVEANDAGDRRWAPGQGRRADRAHGAVAAGAGGAEGANRARGRPAVDAAGREQAGAMAGGAATVTNPQPVTGALRHDQIGRATLSHSCTTSPPRPPSSISPSATMNVPSRMSR